MFDCEVLDVSDQYGLIAIQGLNLQNSWKKFTGKLFGYSSYAFCLSHF